MVFYSGVTSVCFSVGKSDPRHPKRSWSDSQEITGLSIYLYQEEEEEEEEEEEKI
ncbi:hypothetical protein C0J52_16710 [Blattella germanica]|nr:hypothetical protein C0J52_16710 [Blattella germanica]